MIDEMAVAERAKYDDVWKDPNYRVKAHGLELWQTRREIFPTTVRSAIDLGCGHGRLMAQWVAEGIDAVGVDFSVAAPDRGIADRLGDRLHFSCLWDLELGRRFDIGVCADVMEHIPETMVDQTLERIAAHADIAVFKIATHRSVWRGHDLHPTCQPAPWWEERLGKAFDVVERLAPPRQPENWLFRCS